MHPRTTALLVTALSLIGALSATTLAPAASATSATSSTTARHAPAPWILHEWITDGPPLDLMLVRADGTGLRPLMAQPPEPEADTQHGDWSPDGRRVAFEILSPDGSAAVWTVGAAGADPTPAVRCQGPPCLQIAYPAWSPDGRSLLVIRYDVADNGDWSDNWLEVVDLASGARRAIARVPGDQSFYRPRWSPDGRRVVVEIDTYTDATQSELVSTGIAVVDACGRGPSTPRPITRPAMNAANPDWHPWLPLIVFGTNDPVTFRDSDSASNLFTMRPDGRGLRRLTSSVDGTLRYGQPTFTPDGARISLVVNRTAEGAPTARRPALLGIRGGTPVEIGVSGFWPKVQPRRQ